MSLLSPISLGTFQFRISDALTVLPIFSFDAILWLTIGCIIANTYGVFFAQIVPIDIFVGSFATLIAAIISYNIEKKYSRKVCYIIGPLPVVISKALLLGTEVTIFNGENIFLNITHIAITQIVVCYTLGLILMYILYRKNLYKKIFQ